MRQGPFKTNSARFVRDTESNLMNGMFGIEMFGIQIVRFR